jgi:protein yippee-like 5
MGRLYLEHIGGAKIYSCNNCDTPLTNKTEIISTRFTGATGRAYLFGNVVNYTVNEVQERVILELFYCCKSYDKENLSFQFV